MDQTQMSTKSSVKHPFIGALLIVVCAGIVLSALNMTIVSMFALRGAVAEAVTSAVEIAFGIVVLFVVRRRTGMNFGYTRRGLGEGLLLLIPILALAFFSFESDLSQWMDVGSAPAVGMVALCVLQATAAGFYEELMFRGLIVSGVARGMRRGRFWTGAAVAASGALFAGAHIVNTVFGYQDLASTAAQMVYTLSLGFVWTAVYIRTHNLLASTIAHTLIDLAAFLAPDSLAGGTTGAVDIATMGDQAQLFASLVFLLALFCAYAFFVIRPRMRGSIDTSWLCADDRG